MFRYLLLSLLISVTYAGTNFVEMVRDINSLNTTWRAKENIDVAVIENIKKTLGTILPHEDGYIGPDYEISYLYSEVIPESFDVRTNWKNCAPITGLVRDQSSCGSCWAFGSTEAFNDRYCIRTGDSKTIFSPEDTVSCCTGIQCSFSMGCNGGQPAGAWNWFIENGVSTGGDYADVGKGTTCKPYSMQSCAHHVTPPPGMVACDDIEEYSTPKCTNKCSEPNYSKSYSSDKHRASGSYSLDGVHDMQMDMMLKGTLSVSMTVYEDFPTYSSGVYQHVTGKSLGGHAIKMIGWGVENGIEYWLCVNSWNDSWGDKGTFKILKNKNECGIESGVVAGDA